MKFKKELLRLLIGTMFLSACDFSSKKEKLFSLQAEIDTNSIYFGYENLKTAIEHSKEKGLPVFIYFTWDGCGPCLWMERTVFIDSVIKHFYNQNFISAKVHGRRLSSSGIISAEEQKMNKPIDLVMKEYGVYGTPSFVVIDSQGNLIHKSIGASNKEEFLQFGKDALSDDRNYAVIKEQVENGNNSYELVKTYLDGNNPTSKSLKRKKKKIIDNYFTTQELSEWSSVNNWYLIEHHVDEDDYSSKQFQYLLHNTNAFYEKNDRKKIDYKLYRVLSQYFFNGGKINHLGNPIANMIIEREDLKKKNITDLNLYVESFNDIYTSYYYLLAYEINRKSREIYEESVKKSSKINEKTLNIAKKWVELLISYSSEEEYIDTYNKLVSQIKKIE